MWQVSPLDKLANHPAVADARGQANLMLVHQAAFISNPLSGDGTYVSASPRAPLRPHTTPATTRPTRHHGGAPHHSSSRHTPPPPCTVTSSQVLNRQGIPATSGGHALRLCPSFQFDACDLPTQRHPDAGHTFTACENGIHACTHCIDPTHGGELALVGQGSAARMAQLTSMGVPGGFGCPHRNCAVLHDLDAYAVDSVTGAANHSAVRAVVTATAITNELKADQAYSFAPASYPAHG